MKKYVNKIASWFLLLAIVLCSCRKENTIDLSGKVYDHFSGNPISGAFVSISANCGGNGFFGTIHANTFEYTYTNTKGEFAFNVKKAHDDRNCNDWKLEAGISTPENSSKKIKLGSDLHGEYNFDLLVYSYIKVIAIDTSSSSLSFVNALRVPLEVEGTTYPFYCAYPPDNCNLICVSSTINTIRCFIYKPQSNSLDSITKYVYCHPNIIDTVTFKF